MKQLQLVQSLAVITTTHCCVTIAQQLRHPCKSLYSTILILYYVNYTININYLGSSYPPITQRLLINY